MTGMSAVILVGPQGNSAAEQLMQNSIRAAALDLVDRLRQVGIERIIMGGPDLQWVPASSPCVLDEDDGPFHFGTRLASLIRRFRLETLLYFGAGSAPLLTTDLLQMMVGMLAQAGAKAGGGIPSHIALTNNLHSSDWIAISHASDAVDIVRQANRDNSLAWMLQEHWDYDVRVLSSLRPASSMDLDTPTDLAIIQHHPDCSPRLVEEAQGPLLSRIPVSSIVDVLATNGTHVALFGRVAPLAWQALSKRTQCWIRVYSEERGMAASERLARGEVRSLVSSLLDSVGPEAFFARAAYEVDIPVLLGGHGVVAGGLYVLSEIVERHRKQRLS